METGLEACAKGELLYEPDIAKTEAPLLKKLMRPPFFVPETKNLHDLLSEMRSHKTQMAIVQDEFGGTAGIVTGCCGSCTARARCHPVGDERIDRTPLRRAPLAA